MRLSGKREKKFVGEMDEDWGVLFYYNYYL